MNRRAIVEKSFDIILDTIDIRPRRTSIRYVSGDAETMPLTIHLMIEGQPITPPNGAIAQLNFVNSMGTAFPRNSNILPNGSILYSIDSSDIAIPGPVVVSVTAIVGSQRLTWLGFIFNVEKSLADSQVDPPEVLQPWIDYITSILSDHSIRIQQLEDGGGGGGGAGSNGWTPLFSVITSGDRNVIRIYNWIGGSGTRPSIGYLGSTGIVEDILMATNVRGLVGDSGREIELQKTLYNVQWRYIGDPGWKDLIPLSDITGEDGREIELYSTSEYIQWRYVGSTTWTNLIAVSNLIGPKGDSFDPIDVLRIDALDDKVSNIQTTLSEVIAKSNSDGDRITDLELIIIGVSESQQRTLAMLEV